MTTTPITERIGTLVHPAVQGSRRLTAELLWSIPRVGAPVPSPDGRRVVVPVTTYTVGEKSGVTRLWILDADGDAAPRAITASDATAGAPAWAPDGTRLAFTRKAVDDEDAKPQLHLLRLDGGEPERVTDLPLGVLDARWLPDGHGLVVASHLIRDHLTIEATAAEVARRKDDPVKAHATEDRVCRLWDRWLTTGEVPHLFHLDLDTGDVRDLVPSSVAWFDFLDPTGQFDVSPDGEEIAYAGTTLEDEPAEIITRVYRVALSGGEPECITADAPAYTFRPRYTPDGTHLVYGRTEDRHFYADRARIYRYDRTSGTHAPWCTDWDRSPFGWEFATDGTLVFAAESNARSHVYALDEGATEPRVIAEGGTLGPPVPAADGRVYFSHQSVHAPPEIHRGVLDGATPAEPYTGFTAGALDDVALGEVREFHVPASGDGADGEQVQSFVIFPPDHDDTRPAPFVNMVHGGPHGIFGDGFHFRWNAHLFAAPGYVVAMPNFQGSTSWGNDFAERIQGAWGERPFADVMAVTDALVDAGIVDPRRLAAAGGSYGGYMMGWMAGHTDRFACIVNHAGVWNTLSMYATDITQGRPRSFGGEPWDGIEAIDRYNPARWTADMRTPMLVIHGERDYRVPATQALECYGILKAKGVPARLLWFPDENHWVLKPHNSIRWYDEVHAWLARWLGDRSP
ncbi:MAG: S9 family peptidase [Planctomycetes bacterium]|nr:S9 family peptidase [Planctomycetota bacterium]